MKRAALTCLQVAVTVGMLWWIFRDPEKRARMGEALEDARLGWLAAGVVLVGLLTIFSTERWSTLLKVQNIVLPWWRVWRLFMVGLFFNLFLPGGTGGDLIKIFYVVREAPKRKGAALLSVGIDRAIGLLAMVFLTIILSLLGLEKLSSTPVSLSLLFVLAGILGISVGIIVAAVVVSRLKLQDRLPEKMPMRAAIVDFANAFDVYSRDLKALGYAFLISLPNHLVMFLAFYCASRAFTSALSIVDVFTVLPIILTISAMPISVAGLGVREKTTEQLLGALYGIPEHTALLISIGGFMLLVFWNLIGGIVYMTYRSSSGEKASLGEARAESQEIAS